MFIDVQRNGVDSLLESEELDGRECRWKMHDYAS